jgi:tRNA pseudouridine55 synthase
MLLGISTDTQDRADVTLEERPCRRWMKRWFAPRLKNTPAIFTDSDGFSNPQGGVPLYKLRAPGKSRRARTALVHVYRYSIGRIESPEIDFSVVCSKGFYVRTYAHDIGEALGCGAHLKDLRRTKSGRFSVAGAITVDELKTSEPVDILGRILTLPEVSRMRGA